MILSHIDSTAPAAALSYGDALYTQQEQDKMRLRLNDTAPDFSAQTTHGPIHFHEWIGSDWVLFFSHPKDFTPVCTTEIGSAAARSHEFAARGVKLLGLGIEAVENHSAWYKDIENLAGVPVEFPMVGDSDLQIAKLYDMLPAEAGEGPEERTAAMIAPVRTVFVIGPDKKIKLTMAYPMSTGRNFDEILRSIDSLQLAAKHPISTPADWNPGDKILVAMNVSDEEAKQRFSGLEIATPYLRRADQPR